MVRVEIATSPLGPAVATDVTQRERLLDVCDTLRAPISFSCRSASCGTCLVDVLAGADLLEPPSADELEVLALFADAPSQRLACQAMIRAGQGLILLRSVDGSPDTSDAPAAKRLPG